MEGELPIIDSTVILPGASETTDAMINLDDDFLTRRVTDSNQKMKCKTKSYCLLIVLIYNNY